jgi:MFS family permease
MKAVVQKHQKLQKSPGSYVEDEGKQAANRPFLVSFLAFAAGATVANIYYCQPLLQAVSTYFHTDAALTSTISVATQLGFGSGLLLFVPLGDSFERRTLIVGSIVGAAIMLLAAAFSPTLPVLVTVSYLLGLICITPQLIVPYAAEMAKPETRGRTVGIVIAVF